MNEKHGRYYLIIMDETTHLTAEMLKELDISGQAFVKSEVALPKIKVSVIPSDEVFNTDERNIPRWKRDPRRRTR